MVDGHTLYIYRCNLTKTLAAGTLVDKTLADKTLALEYMICAGGRV